MKKYCIIGVLIVSVLGTLFHFGYTLLEIFIIPKNESIFEHTKLILFLFYSIYLRVYHFTKRIEKLYFPTLCLL